MGKDAWSEVEGWGGEMMNELLSIECLANEEGEGWFEIYKG
jgi:hypothetical protein